MIPKRDRKEYHRRYWLDLKADPQRHEAEKKRRRISQRERYRRRIEKAKGD